MDTMDLADILTHDVYFVLYDGEPITVHGTPIINTK